MSGAVFTLGNSVSGSLSLGSALSKFGRVAGQAGFTIEQEEETINNTVTSRYAGLAAVTVSGVTSVLNPSLVLIPSAYNTSGSTGILYSLHSKPNGVGDFVVTRATEGTRFNSVGKISTVGSGDARLDYYTSGGTAGPPALLVEPSAENLTLRSENFGTTWGLVQLLAFGSGSVLNTTGTLDPYGTNVADLIVANTVLDQHRVDQTTVSVSGSYTFSIFLKAAGYNFGRLRLNGIGATFNLGAGTISSTDTGIVSSIQSYGNGWYRCIISNAAAAANAIVRVNILQSGSGDFEGNGTSGIYIFGSQYELGTVATSYIPTTTAAVTRNADVISVSSAGSGCIGQTEGTIYWEGESLVSGAQDIISINQSNTNSVAITKLITNVYRCVVIASGTALTVDDTVVKTGFVKIAFAYKSGDTALFINGAQVGSTNTTVFTFSGALSSLIFGPGDYYSGRPDQKCRTVALYSTRLTNAQLAALTT
jgi:hypothetical protein